MFMDERTHRRMSQEAHRYLPRTFRNDQEIKIVSKLESQLF